MARQSYKKGKKRGGKVIPAAAPSTYSDGASFMKATVGSENEQYDNVFVSGKANGYGNAIVGLQGQKAGGKRRQQGNVSKKNTKKRKGGYWG